MQLAAPHGLEMHQMDVKTAYPHAPIDCEVYMEQPEGFEVKSKTGEKLVWTRNCTFIEWNGQCMWVHTVTIYGDNQGTVVYGGRYFN